MKQRLRSNLSKALLLILGSWYTYLGWTDTFYRMGIFLVPIILLAAAVVSGAIILPPPHVMKLPNDGLAMPLDEIVRYMKLIITYRPIYSPIYSPNVPMNYNPIVSEKWW